MPDKGLLSSLTLARGSLDRAAARREAPAWFDAVWQADSTRVVVVHRGRALVRDATHPEGQRGSVELDFATPGDLAELSGVRVLLAVEDDVPFVALLVDSDTEPWESEGEGRWSGLREVGSTLGDRDAGLLVMAVALANWHAAHPRCPRCGAPTASSQAGWSRTCPEDSSQHFPRSDPAVIVLITDDADRALLGRRGDWPEGWFSTLAGFVEAGESAEMAVAREMAEEAGVVVDRLDYLGSQPWPFPSSLMLGYRARIAPGSPEAVPDGDEIHEVRWFTRAELRQACEAGTARIPGSVSIARRLVEHWYGTDLPAAWSRP